jgi:hypothetical protein
MNERLKQLAREAGLLHYNPNREPNKLEKFANSIIAECIGVVENGSVMHDQAPDAEFARACSNAIKRHFGALDADIALDAMSENARQIGLDYD